MTYVLTTCTVDAGKITYQVDGGHKIVCAIKNPIALTEFIVVFSDNFTPTVGTALTQPMFSKLLSEWMENAVPVSRLRSSEMTALGWTASASAPTDVTA